MPSGQRASSEITDEQILSYNNVPIEVAAKYIGHSTVTIYRTLQDRNAPFGYATKTNDEEGKPRYTYNISPGLLVAYKRGTLPMLPVSSFIEQFAHLLDESFAVCNILGVALQQVAKKKVKNDSFFTKLPSEKTNS